MRPKRSLGQNFLVDPNLQRAIVRALDVQASDEVLEIGPGTGALTRHLVDLPRRLVLVELDRVLADRLALGVVPTLLWNPRIQDHDREAAVSVGVNGQLYLDERWSLFGEWIFSQTREDQEYDAGSFGAEIRTRGHFFKLVVTNQHQMNPTQTLAGAAEDFFDPGSWRFGFNLQRRVRF